MISDRVRGVHQFTLAIQGVGVSVLFWLWFWLLLVRKSADDHMLQVGTNPGQWIYKYLLYNGFLVFGLLVGSSFWQVTSSFIQPSFKAVGRYTLRQLLAAFFYLFILVVASNDHVISRGFIFSFLPICFLLLFATNLQIPAMLASRLLREQQEERVLLVGTFAQLDSLGRWMRAKSALGFRFIGALSDQNLPSETGVPIIGKPAELEQVAKEKSVTQLVLVGSPDKGSTIKHYVDFCERQGIRFAFLNDLDGEFGRSVAILPDEGVFLVTLREEPLQNPVNRMLKRTLDVAVSLPIVLFLLPPVSVVVWLLQCWQSPGSVFYRQERKGFLNKPFQIIKFRTMRPDHGKDAVQVTPGDARVFPAGHWMRRLSIDELPQFLNVFYGEMSVVGPRPCLKSHDLLFAENRMYARVFVKPGITGLAQVRGFRGEIRTNEDILKRAEADIYYLENWSVFLDIFLILRTIGVVFIPPKNAK
jgi:exopolysaccharide biosynthesis polyprenyl glycosylphosphotransferase